MTATTGILIRTLVAFTLAAALPAFAETDEETVARRIEEFRSAQATKNASALAELSAPELSYGHSSGKVEDRAAFIANSTSGKSSFIVLDYRNPTIRIAGSTAIVRFNWYSEQQAALDEKKTTTQLHILMVWQKQEGAWRLLARGSTKL